MLQKRIKEFNERASWLREGVLYHRGKHNENIKENSMKAFEEAVKDNLGVELDVRLTKDNLVVVSHDSNLNRVYGINKNIDDLTYEEVKKLTNDGVPLFSDVLKLINNKIGVMVEIKSNKVGKLEEIVYEILKKYKGRYVIVCFNPFTLRYFRKKDKSIIRGQLSYSYYDSKLSKIKRFLLSHLWLNVFSKPHFISYGIDHCNYKLQKKYHDKGYFVIGWTYKDEKNKVALKEIYDNMIIENLNIREF